MSASVVESDSGRRRYLGSQETTIPLPSAAKTFLGYLSVRTLVLIVGFIGLRKQGETQSLREGRDANLTLGLNDRRELTWGLTDQLGGHPSRSRVRKPEVPQTSYVR